MNDILLKSLQIEYESTPISISELCTKHKLNKEDIPYLSWKKHNELVVLESSPLGTQTPPSIPSDNISDEEDDMADKLRTNINKTAKALLSTMQTMIVDADLTPKDAKDIASAITSIKDSVLGKDPSVKIDITNNTQVNVLSQVVEAIKGAKRDC